MRISNKDTNKADKMHSKTAFSVNVFIIFTTISVFLVSNDCRHMLVDSG